MFGVHDLVGDEVVVESEDTIKAASTIPVSDATTTTTVITNDEITLAKALAALKSAKLPTTTAATTIIAVSKRPRAKGLVIHKKQEQAPTPTVSSRQPSKLNVQYKGKGKRKMARVEADYQLAQRLQAQEQEELTNEEKARLFVQFLEQRRKHFAAKRAEEKRNKPPTRAQQKSIMVHTFVDYITELVEESSKKAEIELVEESSKKAEPEIAHESNDGDDVTIDATPLSIKSPTIVDYKIYKEGKKSYFQIIRADGKTRMYLTFGKMLKIFDREDMEIL
ncbi:hypothetical protein Tco_0984006 [Tanacetum coccineum]